MRDFTALLSDVVGQPITAMRVLQGGDLSELRELTLADGSRVVAKIGDNVLVEAQMLRALADAGVPAPRVLQTRPLLIILEHLPETRPAPASWPLLGQVVRDLHRAPVPPGAPWGWPADYAFGSVLIPGTIHGVADWPEYWARARLLQGLEAVPIVLARRLEALAMRLPDLLPAAPRPALLHGDLWAGNLLFGPGGGVHLIDPACSIGHAEVDLAMLHLFGRPGEGFSESYGALEPGWDARRPIYQLWPALVHLRLFGDGYLSLVESLLESLPA